MRISGTKERGRKIGSLEVLIEKRNAKWHGNFLERNDRVRNNQKGREEKGGRQKNNRKNRKKQTGGRFRKSLIVQNKYYIHQQYLNKFQIIII